MRSKLAAILTFSICFLTISQSIAKSDTSNDELHKSYTDPPDLLNPLISQDMTSADLRRLTTESFARRRVQNPEEWELFFAKEWEKTETDDGKLIFDIKLREGVKWHRSEYGKIGARVEVTPLVWGQYLKILRESKYDAYILGWALGWEHDPYTFWHSSQIDEPESFNDVSYRNQEVDKLIETLRYTLDKKKQIELYHKIHRIIYSDQPYCFLWSRKRTGAYSARLLGVRFYSTINPGYDEREWSTVPGMERVK